MQTFLIKLIQHREVKKNSLMLEEETEEHQLTLEELRQLIEDAVAKVSSLTSLQIILNLTRDFQATSQ